MRVVTWTRASMLATTGLLLMLGAPTLLWVRRRELFEVGPRAFTAMGDGAGGIVLLYMAAGLPLGALLMTAGGARLFASVVSARRVLLPLFGVQLLYFIFHGVAAFRYKQVPFALFALLGILLVAIFIAFVFVWAAKRPLLEPERRRGVDLQLGGGLCFFTAAWEACGLAGPPGSAVYPELSAKLANQSYLVGQALAVKLFCGLGFILLILAMRAESPRNSVGASATSSTGTDRRSTKG